MKFYEHLPEGLVITSHQHNWQGISGSVWATDSIPEPVYIDLSWVNCMHCGRKYLASLLKDGKITECLGCGSSEFIFNRRN